MGTHPLRNVLLSFVDFLQGQMTLFANNRLAGAAAISRRGVEEIKPQIHSAVKHVVFGEISRVITTFALSAIPEWLLAVQAVHRYDIPTTWRSLSRSLLSSAHRSAPVCICLP